MKTNAKIKTAKKDWRGRETFTWHLRAPFKDKFDHTHWWKNATDSKIEPIAALYELVRRHPRVGQLLSFWESNKEQDDDKITYDSFTLEPDQFIHLTSGYALKSWPNLNASEQEFWKSWVSKLKGLDFRNEKCVNVNLSKSFRFTRKNGTPVVKELSFKERAGRFQNEGFLLLAIAPDLKMDEAISLMEKEYRFHQRKHPITKRRARWQDWLPSISKFEENEADGNKVKNPSLTTYRRIINGVCFE